MVLHSVIRHCSLTGSSNHLPHVVISNLEHDSIDVTVQELVGRGLVGEWVDGSCDAEFQLCTFSAIIMYQQP